jgi:hypothetical protein
MVKKVFLIQLIEVKPSTLPAFDVVQSQVEKSYVQHEEIESFKTWIKSSWMEISSGKSSLESFAKKISTPVQTTETFAYSATNLVPELGENAEVMNEAFAVSKEKPYFSHPIQMDHEYVFIKLKDKTEPDWKKFEIEKANLADVLHQQSAQTRFTAWMTASEKNAKIKRQLGESSDAQMPIED